MHTERNLCIHKYINALMKIKFETHAIQEGYISYFIFLCIYIFYAYIYDYA